MNEGKDWARYQNRSTRLVVKLMRILLIGAGGVGDAIVKIAAGRNFFEKLIVSDYDLERAQRSVDWVAQWHAFSEVALQTTSAFFIQMMYNICCLQSKIGATCLWQHEVTPGTRHLVRARLDGPRAHPSRPSDDRKQCRIAFKRRRVAKTSCGEAVGAPCTKSMLAKARGRAPPSPNARPACPQRLSFAVNSGSKPVVPCEVRFAHLLASKAHVE